MKELWHSDPAAYRSENIKVWLLLECYNLSGWIISDNSLHVVDVFWSVKFMDKVRYVHTLEELSQIIPMEHVQIPECVLQ